MSLRTTVWCTAEFAGIHNWPDATRVMLPEVDPEGATRHYLEMPHRHNFHVRLEIEVRHSNRQIEFIELKGRMLNFIYSAFGVPQLGARSCEMMAQEIAEWALNDFQLPRGVTVSCTVSEDGENGSTVYVS